MNKKVFRFSEVKDKVVKAVDTLADPIRQTMSPKGGNVIYEDDRGDQFVTNDGVTIAKNIRLKDPVENAVVEIIKHSALRTNTEAGDGTSTTILLSSILIKEGIRLIENEGWNRMDLKREYEIFADQMIENLKGQIRKIESDDDLFFVSKISANNDDEIAKDIVRVVKVAGQDGHVIIEPSFGKETEIIEDTGFIIEAGMLTPELRNNPQAMMASYNDVPVLITDKRLYYAQEAETILKTCLMNGYKQVVIVAQDFIGEALPFFVANHQQGQIQVLLVKDVQAKEGTDTLEDLATYLGGKVIAEKNGSIVDKLTIEDFVIANRVFSDTGKTVIIRKTEDTKAIEDRVETLRKEMDKIGNQEDPKHMKLKKRVSSLTNGMVTIKVAGNNPLEIREKIFRYEDAVNAARAAMRDGYLVGGGLSVFWSFMQTGVHPELHKTFKRVAEANIRQIAENCGLYGDNVIENILTFDPDMNTYGFNAMSGQFEDLLQAGIIDPFKVTEMAIRNSVSIANVFISSDYIVINDIEEKDGK